jgi:hypothetical protein
MGERTRNADYECRDANQRKRSMGVMDSGSSIACGRSAYSDDSEDSGNSEGALLLHGEASSIKFN